MEALKDFVSIFITSILMILLGLVYFMVNLWIVNTGASVLGVTADLPVLGAVLLTFAGIISSALHERKR